MRWKALSPRVQALCFIVVWSGKETGRLLLLKRWFVCVYVYVWMYASVCIWYFSWDDCPVPANISLQDDGHLAPINEQGGSTNQRLAYSLIEHTHYRVDGTIQFELTHPITDRWRRTRWENHSCDFTFCDGLGWSLIAPPDAALK